MTNSTNFPGSPSENLEKNEKFDKETKELTIFEVENIINFSKNKKKLKEIIPKLQGIGLKIDENGILDFSNLKGISFWPSINGAHLIYFPNKDFNKKNGIGNENGIINSKEDLEKLFNLFGFKTSEIILKNEKNNEDHKKDNEIENDEKEIEKYKKDLENIIGELQKIGLKIEENGNLNLTNLKGRNFWPKINGKSLYSFPSLTFNKKHKIGNKNGALKSKKDLENLFIILGFKVEKIENDEKEIEKYKKDLENIIEELQKIGLKIEENGNLNLTNLKGNNFWPKINGKNLFYFPSATFNKKHKLGNKTGGLISKKDLENLFILLGFKVNKIKNSKFFIENYEKEIEIYKKDLKNIIEKLQKIGLKIENDGSLDFSNLSHRGKWPKINGKNLFYFPSPAFNKKHKIGDKNGALTSKKDLEKLFIILDFKINKKTNPFIESDFNSIKEEEINFKYENLKDLSDFKNDFYSIKIED